MPPKSLMDFQTRDLVDLVASVPSLPANRLELLARMRDPEAAVPEIVELLTRDQAFADKVLTLVNCAFGGDGAEIRSISRAVVILGFRAVRSAALAVSVSEYFKGGADNQERSLAFWRHSVAVAVIGKVLATELHFHQPEEAYVAGLLHDVGRLFEERHFPDDCRDANAVAEEQRYSWHQCEKALFAVNHASIAAAFFRAWEFPGSVIDAVERHHEPESSTRVPQLTALVHLADIMSYELGHGAPGTWPPGETCPGALLLLGVTMADTAVWHEKIRIELDNVAGILALMS
jgi:putative nucleotidyltransferase with HDIG domain